MLEAVLDAYVPGEAVVSGIAVDRQLSPVSLQDRQKQVSPPVLREHVELDFFVGLLAGKHEHVGVLPAFLHEVDDLEVGLVYVVDGEAKAPQLALDFVIYRPAEVGDRLEPSVDGPQVDMDSLPLEPEAVAVRRDAEDVLHRHQVAQKPGAREGVVDHRKAWR